MRTTKLLLSLITVSLLAMVTLVHDLYPTIIDQLGLYEALKAELKHFEPTFRR